MDNSWQDELFVLDKLHGNHYALLKDDPKLQDDKEVVLAALEQSAGAFVYASERLKNDPEIVEIAVKKWPGNFKHASLALRSNLDFALKMLEKSHEPYYALSKELQVNEQVMRLALAHVDFLLTSSFIDYSELPEHLKNDRDFMLLFITKIPDHYPVINEDFKNERAFVNAYVTKFTSRFVPLPEKYMRDKSVALLLVSYRGYHLKHIAEIFGDDFDVVRTAVSSSGSALKYASERLQNNLEICALAYRRDKSVLPLIPQAFLMLPPIVAARVKHGDLKYNDLLLELREDALVTIEALKKVHAWYELRFYDIPDKVYNNAAVLKVAARKNIEVLEKASAELLDNKELLNEIIYHGSYDGQAKLLKYVSPRLQNDKEIVRGAILLSADNFKYASEHMRDDEELAFIALSKNAELYHSLSPRLQEESSFIKRVLKENELIFNELDENKRGDKTFVKYIANRPRALNNVALSLANNKDFILEMAKAKHGRYLMYLKSDCLSDLKFMQKVIKHDIDALYALKIKRNNVPKFREYLTPEQYLVVKDDPLYKINERTTNFDFYWRLELKGEFALRDFERELLFANHEYTPAILTNLKGKRHKKKLLINVLLNAMKHEYTEVITTIFANEVIRRRVVLHYYGEALETNNAAIIKLFNDFIKPLPLTYEELIARKKASGH